MSFEYSPDNQKDNDRRSLRPDSNGDAARNVVSADLQGVLEDILIALGGSGGSSTATIFNVACPLANTEYSQVLPANTKKFVIKARNSSKILFAYEPSATNYLTVNAGFSFVDDNFYTSVTVYFKNSKADEVVEIVAYV
jgi:hypothetical protein